MRRSNLATLIYLAVVFASGAVVGGFAVRLYSTTTVTAGRTTAPRDHAEIRRQYIKEMQGRLHLNGTQVTELQQICETTGQHMRDVRKSVDDEHVQKVIGILDDNQKTEYAKMREEREKKRRQEQQAKK
jgi:hypothetical protein